MTKKSIAEPSFLLEPSRPGSAIATDAKHNSAFSEELKKRLNVEIGGFAEKARQDLSSSLLRLPAAHTKFGLARSTYLKWVSMLEAPQRVYCGARVTAYREIDLNMMLAAQALASRHGFMLNNRAFIAALSAPVDPQKEC